MSGGRQSSSKHQWSLIIEDEKRRAERLRKRLEIQSRAVMHAAYGIKSPGPV